MIIQTASIKLCYAHESLNVNHVWYPQCAHMHTCTHKIKEKLKVRKPTEINDFVCISVFF